MTVLPPLWPGLILGLIALAVWLHFCGVPRYREWSAREQMRNQGYCPDCGLRVGRCHCFTDTDF